MIKMGEREHKDGCKCKACCEHSHRLESVDDFWLRVGCPKLWKWLEQRKKVANQIQNKENM